MESHALHRELAGWPCPRVASVRGNRAWSSLTYSGTYDDMLFFQLPNHRSTRRISLRRASVTRESTSATSNCPSRGSMSSQYAGDDGSEMHRAER